LHFPAHLAIIKAKEQGKHLIVGVTSENYDKTRGKLNVKQSLLERIDNVKRTGLADEIIVEEYLGQKIDDIKKLLAEEQAFNTVREVRRFFGKKHATQEHSYIFILYKKILESAALIDKTSTAKETLKKYVFIIDEINRGEISKILGELFFSIDPGYRGEDGGVFTQYANLHANPDEKFYIPENVYIIGTMNDIDRSVDTFHFAMRRRFRFIEIKANESVEMLEDLGNKKDEAIRRMNALNEAIDSVEDLNSNYHIGASYFLKLKKVDFDQLWTDYLQPLLQEYINGMYNDKQIMKKFEEAYGFNIQNEGDDNEAIAN
jgi:glycerol-3-phosphate cytidylyltransferase-like family protein